MFGALPVVLAALLASSQVSGQQLDDSSAAFQQTEQEAYLGFPNDNDQQQQLISFGRPTTSSFGARPTNSGRQAGRPDFSSFGLRPTTSTTTEGPIFSQQEQQQKEDAELANNQQQVQQTEDENDQNDQQQQVNVQPSPRPTGQQRPTLRPTPSGKPSGSQTSTESPLSQQLV